MFLDDLELKKLVYLYLINYAKSNPEMAIMVVNTFVKDSAHSSPLIRALAVRTMGCIRVDRITEYLCDPLKRALADEVPLCPPSPAPISMRGLHTAPDPLTLAVPVSVLGPLRQEDGRCVCCQTPRH